MPWQHSTVSTNLTTIQIENFKNMFISIAQNNLYNEPGLKDQQQKHVFFKFYCSEGQNVLVQNMQSSSD